MRSIFLSASLLALAGCSGPSDQLAPTAALVEEAATTEGASQAGVATLEGEELAGMIERGEVVLIDVRTPSEFAEGRIPGALNAPIETFDPASIPMEAGRETVLYCRSARRSERAAEMLAEYSGSEVRHLAGGITAWEEAEGEIIGGP